MKQLDTYKIIEYDKDRIDDFRNEVFYQYQRACPTQFDRKVLNDLMCNKKLASLFNEIDSQMEIDGVGIGDNLITHNTFFDKNRVIMSLLIGFSYGLESDKYVPLYYAAGYLNCAQGNDDEVELGASSRKAAELLGSKFNEEDIHKIQALIDVCEMEKNVGALEEENIDAIYQKYNIDKADYSNLNTFKQIINDSVELSNLMISDDSFDFFRLETTPARKLLDLSLSIKNKEMIEKTKGKHRKLN